jgi:hypothetical protein
LPEKLAWIFATFGPQFLAKIGHFSFNTSSERVAYFSEKLHRKSTENSSSSWPQIMKRIQKIFMAQLSDLQVPTKLIAFFILMTF